MPRSRRIRWGGNNGPIPLGDSVDYWPVPTEALDQFPGPKYFEPIERLRLAAIERADMAQARADLARAEIDRATAKAKKERNDRAATYGRGRREAMRADRFRETERLRHLAELNRQEAERKAAEARAKEAARAAIIAEWRATEERRAAEARAARVEAARQWEAEERAKRERLESDRAHWFKIMAEWKAGRIT